jgi:hypothetical protein
MINIVIASEHLNISLTPPLDRFPSCLLADNRHLQIIPESTRAKQPVGLLGTPIRRHMVRKILHGSSLEPPRGLFLYTAYNTGGDDDDQVLS